MSATHLLDVDNGARVRGDALDVADLPTYAFGHRAPMWWGTIGVAAIEGMVFVLAVATYFYLWSHAQRWPMSVLPPDLAWGTLNTVILIASVVPNEYTRRVAKAHDLRGARIGLVWCIAFAAAFIAVRFLEFGALNVRWNTNAYGSAVWTLLGLHTTHLVTDFVDTVVLAVLMFAGPLEGRRFVDVEENAVYFNFVVAAWLPIYAVLYWSPRL